MGNQMLFSHWMFKRRRNLIAVLTVICIALPLIRAGGASAQPGSYNGLMLQAQNTGSFTIPPGVTYMDINQVGPNNIPADGLSNYTVVYRLIVYASAGADATTCTVGITEGPFGSVTLYSPPVTVPAYTTVAVPFEEVATAEPGELIEASSAVGAGAQGAVTVGFFSSFTVVAYPTQ
jgi:hypothetical protein